MGSFARKVRRNQQKKRFKEFSRTFKEEKAYQLYLKAKGEELPEGQRELTHRPTFQQWKEILARVPVEPLAVPPDPVEPTDLEWKED